jgi:hypothetical protein
MAAKAKTKKSSKVKKVVDETTEEVKPEKTCRQSAPSNW